MRQSGPPRNALALSQSTGTGNSGAVQVLAFRAEEVKYSDALPCAELAHGARARSELIEDGSRNRSQVAATTFASRSQGMKTTLSIINKYGNVDVRNGLRKGYVHIRGKRLQPLCCKLKIKFAPALVGFDCTDSFRNRAVIDGVVVTARSASKLAEEIKEREKRARTPAAMARKERARIERERSLEARRQAEASRARQREERCARIGIDPDGQTAEWLFSGQIDDDLAELIGWKARYRHHHTDYDQQFVDEDFEDLLSYGLSPQEASDEIRSEARQFMRADPIPVTWPEYLEKYDFDSPVARALANVLSEPQRCHPNWFKEAEIVVRRCGLPLDALNFEVVRDAIDCWRRQRQTNNGLPNGRRF
jgi:hypothetical protein